MKKYALLCALLALHAGASFAKDWKEIRMASEGAYPPFNLTTYTPSAVQSHPMSVNASQPKRDSADTR